MLYQWLGNILKQLQLSGVNTEYFLKGVLCLKGKQTRTYINGIKKNRDNNSSYYNL